MTDDPENLRKFLESDDPAMVLMGLSMAKGTKVILDVVPLSGPRISAMPSQGHWRRLVTR